MNDLVTVPGETSVLVWRGLRMNDLVSCPR